MPIFDLVRESAIRRSPRVQQLEGLFDVAPAERTARRARVELDLDSPWKIGAVIGASGSGKSTLLREAFPVIDYRWDPEAALIDELPGPIKLATEALSSVGFSSPPAWLRPFQTLSNGEQFRATVARALLDDAPLVAIDEFTSVVDRQVAQVGSAAVAKAVRRGRKQLVVASCHYDILEWLQPDWVYDCGVGDFQRRLLQRRPPVDLEIARLDPAAWSIFKHHHYLSSELKVGAKCFGGFVKDRLAAFGAVLPFPHATVSGWREHRLVCLPDFQGIGIGHHLSGYIASLFAATGRPYYSTTTHPGFIGARLRSPNWQLTSRALEPRRRGNMAFGGTGRSTKSFKWVGEKRPRVELEQHGLGADGRNL